MVKQAGVPLPLLQKQSYQNFNPYRRGKAPEEERRKVLEKKRRYVLKERGVVKKRKRSGDKGKCHGKIKKSRSRKKGDRKGKNKSSPSQRKKQVIAEAYRKPEGGRSGKLQGRKKGGKRRIWTNSWITEHLSSLTKQQI